MYAQLPKKILILASNPLETGRLRLGEEERKIKEVLLDKASKREQFDIESCQATRYGDLNYRILKYKPNIVQFSGHGIGTELIKGENPNIRKLLVVDGLDIKTGGLIVEDESGKVKLVGAKALTGLFRLFADTIECVVLNACFSHQLAQAIAKYIPYVVGMGTAIGDRAAIEFAVAFYSALGEGESYERSFEYARNAIDLAGIPESDTPKLFHQLKSKREEQPSEQDRNSSNSTQPISGEYKQLIDKFISGNIVPFLGAGINSNFYIDLVPSLVKFTANHLDEQNLSEENWISDLIGNCPYLDKPGECELFQGIEAEVACSLYKQMLDKEQTLAVARINMRYISQYFSLKSPLIDLYDELREIFKDMKSNSPNKIHEFFAKLPGLMKLKGYPKRWKGLPYPMIITTNYDNLLERAFDNVGQEYDVLYYTANEKGGEFKHKDREEAIINSEYDNLPLRKPWKKEAAEPRIIILKLYGTLEDQFIMTQDQVNCFASGLRNKLPNIIKNVLSGTRSTSILFLGCSPSDSELQLITNQIWADKRLPKSSFMFHQSKPGELDREIWGEEQWGVKLIELNSSLDDFVVSLQKEIEARIEE